PCCVPIIVFLFFLSFFFTVPATTEIYTLSLHDALPICRTDAETPSPVTVISTADIQATGYTTFADVVRTLSADNSGTLPTSFGLDRKSTRLNSSHVKISYAVFCLKKKKKKKQEKIK